MKTNKYYDRLEQLRKEYPELTYNNTGYEYLPNEVKEKHKEQIAEITEILRITVAGFLKFENFKMRKDGSFFVRLQYDWNHNTSGPFYEGVGYFPLEDFKNFEEDE